MPTKPPPNPTPAPMSPSELLAEAGRWIDGHGWIQNTFYEPGTLAACAVGALEFASRNGGYGRDWQARRAAIAAAESALADVATELNGGPVDAPSIREQVQVWNNCGVIDQADAVVWMQKASAHAAEAGR
ncbi:hypothetical protein L2K20_03485 [Mycobacterium sp. MBM]|nr:hypothetical protein [Mycobacterium sp. MBM]